MKPSLFELTGVSYSYQPAIPALLGINLQVRPGEQLVVLGANGCGKTTLLRLMGGLIFPGQGEIKVFGEMLSEDKLENAVFRASFRSQVGFVFQNPDVQLFCPTVYEELAFGPLQLDLPHDEVRKRVDDLLAMLGISALQARAPHHLSGGEKKKVAIASVLAMNPEVLLLDEPTTGLDPRTQSWLLDLLTELAKAGKTIIIATHELAMAERIASRAIVLAEDHTIMADGNPTKILSDTDLLLKANLIQAPKCRSTTTEAVSSAYSCQPATPPPYPFTAACKKIRW